MMTTTSDPIPSQFRRSPYLDDPSGGNIHNPKRIPILPSSGPSMLSPGDRMDGIQSSAPMVHTVVMSSPVGQSREGVNNAGPGSNDGMVNGQNGQIVGAAAAAQQPKVVQTAFIHKLYNMLEDQSIQHLISWSNTNESFVMSPSSEFSKVLAQYFKHTNISSFVRQLNMYGFHKVSDVFHTGSPDTPLWEFKHGNGSFKRGDLVGLREIKRRASRHTLTHRDSFSAAAPKPGPHGYSQPGTPVEPMPETLESRMSILEQSLYDVSQRLVRTEDSLGFYQSKSQILSEGLTRCHQWNSELSTHLMSMIQDTESNIYRDLAQMQRDIQRNIDMMRTIDESPDSLLPSTRPPFLSHNSFEPGAPMSPRQLPQDEQRRPSLLSTSRPGSFRPPMPPHLAISPRRYGSIGNSSFSPLGNRPQAQPPPPPPPPPTFTPTNNNAIPPPPTNLPRRHTSADIRLQGWNGGPQPPLPGIPNQHSPYASGASSAQWPSSPQRPPLAPGDEQLRNALASYELPKGPRAQSTSRNPSPPQPPMPLNEPGSARDDNGWTLPGARFPYKGLGLDTPGPPTRRSSMASNVHSLLNPEGPDGQLDGDGEREEDRKRKRLG